MELFNTEVERQYVRVLADVSLGDPRASYALAQTYGVQPGHMHSTALGEVLAALLSLVGQGRPADLVSLWAEVKDSLAVNNAGGKRWLLDLVVSQLEAWPHALPRYAEAVRDLALRREIRQRCAKLMEQCSDPSVGVATVLADATGEMARLTRGTTKLRTVQDSLADSVLLELEQKGRGVEERIIPTGLPSLDMLIGGLQPTLIVVVADASVGKSAFLATVAQSVAARGRKIGVFSLEDDGDWVTWRLLAAEAKVNQFQMRYQRIDDATFGQIAEAGARVHNYGARILLDDRPGLTPQDVVQSAREMVLVHGVDALILDHLGELHLGRKRERFDLEVDEALRDLRDLTKTHHIPFVVACHTRRLDPGQAPKLSDVANAIGISRKARLALGLSRPPDGDMLRIEILKQTNGVQGKHISIPFIRRFAMVEDDGTAKVEDAQR